MLHVKVAVANLADSRPDFFARRKCLVDEEIKALDWLRKDFDIIESGVLTNSQDIYEFAQGVKSFGAQSLIVHLPVWADPIFTVKLYNHIQLPMLLLGNSRPETSSIVGLLGAGGALDQLGCEHIRVFDHTTAEARQPVLAFVRAAAARGRLKGQTAGFFGGRSLGIFTAEVDPAQWERLFGVEVEYIDQSEIVETGNGLDLETVKHHVGWLTEKVGKVEFGELFTPDSLERQVRSYIATRELISKYKLDFVGVKCQPELSDGYASQCVSHMLMNGLVDADGDKKAVVHACESDADGALTMQILHLLSGGKPAALLDIRWFNAKTGNWTLCNCGAMPAAFFSTEKDSSGLSGVSMTPHVFGKGGGCALSAVATPQPVTLARLIRKSGEYRMVVISGKVEECDRSEMMRTTEVFPQALVKSSAGLDFLSEFGSNHIHMVSGNFAEEIIAFCRLVGISYKYWN